MNDPVLVEVTRGAIVESAHRGVVAICDAGGKLVLGLGETDRPIFPRSAVKAFQALPLVESGAADLYRLHDEELALAIASHSGEPDHVRVASGMLAKAGRDHSCLECGSHWPLRIEAARALAMSGGVPNALHNNCSGKHAGFICLACAEDVDPAGYVAPDHRVQRQVKAALEDMVGLELDPSQAGIDGCSIPTYAVPLAALARGFARFGTGEGLSETRRLAAERLRAAAAAQPFMVAGTGRFDTLVMRALGARAFLKTGAEGVYCAALPELGLGIALKCDDGATRASETAMASILQVLLPLNAEEAAEIGPWARKPLTNWRGLAVGEVRVSATLEKALDAKQGYRI